MPKLPRPVPAGPVTYSPWRPAAAVHIVVSAALAGIIIGTVWSTFWERGKLAGEEYHLWRWQTETLLDTVFSRIGIGPSPEGEEAALAIRAYFGLTTQIRDLSEAAAPDLALIQTLTNERAIYENDVERYVEGLVDDALVSVGLKRALPLFSGVRLTWPPVDFELTTPPRLLIRSPRDLVRRDGDTLLKPGLEIDDIERIERETSDGDTVSLVVGIGGLAAYPAIVTADRSYGSLLDTASHEWVHHYLAFYPLGAQWGNGGDAETLNETTASIAGRELAGLIQMRRPLTFDEGGDGRRSAGQPVTVDFNKEMRETRLEVDRLLGAGQVVEAEAYMEERRQFLERNGIVIRKLNQAYFAFYGTYADGPASSNPVGPKIERVWELTKDVGRFLKVMRDVTNVRDLDESLALLEAAAGGTGGVPTSP